MLKNPPPTGNDDIRTIILYCYKIKKNSDDVPLKILV